MKSIQTTALILWMAIFIAAAFFLGQFLASKNIFDTTSFILGENSDEKTDEIDIEDDMLGNEVVINKIGQETVRIGLNIASDYFSDNYYNYIDYIMNNIDKYSQSEKVTINDTLASDYIFYVASRNLDFFDHQRHMEDDDAVVISEAEINSAIDIMFGKNIDEAFKMESKYGYDKTTKKYTVEKDIGNRRYSVELQDIENITSNEVVLTYEGSKLEDEQDDTKTIKLRCVYKGGRYIVTEVQII